MATTAEDGTPETEVDDDAASDTTVAPEAYAISSFGIDFDVEGLVRRLKKEEIFVPHFQRNYVWKQSEASQFIESLLLGLPVPGVFLAKERDSQRLLIIDGQQRLKTLQFFYEGFFKPEEGEKKRKVFELVDVQKPLEGKTYEKLTTDERGRLDNSVIHATIIKQESPKESEDTSLYYIFGRLNSGGRKLNTQEIRSALYYGAFADKVEELNNNDDWRAIYGRPSERIKDQELIVRFLALYFDSREYRRPMEDFLNRFAARHQKGPAAFLKSCETIFTSTIQLVRRSLGNRAFRRARAINAAVFDAITVGLARRLKSGPIEAEGQVKSAYDALMSNEAFSLATSKATADETNVANRLKLATEAFANVQ